MHEITQTMKAPPWAPFLSTASDEHHGGSPHLDPKAEHLDMKRDHVRGRKVVEVDDRQIRDKMGIQKHKRWRHTAGSLIYLVGPAPLDALR